MSLPMPMARDLFLCEEISGESVRPIITSILSINYDDTQKEIEYKDWKREPIRLFINSPGGQIYDGLSLIDIIQQSKTPVQTIAIGHVMSMGLWIFMSSSERLVGRNSTLMWHDVATGVWDKTETIRQELDEMLRLQKKSIDIITQKSIVKKETLQSYIDRKAEWYIPAEQAIKLHLATGYYNS